MLFLWYPWKFHSISINPPPPFLDFFCLHKSGSPSPSAWRSAKIEIFDFCIIWKPSMRYFRMGLFLKYGEAVLKIFTVFKACVHFFYQFFTISQNDSPLKTMKNECFLFHLKGSFRSQDIHIFVIFFLPFHAFQIRKDKWKWNNLWCHKLTCLNLQMQFLE